VFGNQFGTALGFLIPPVIVVADSDGDLIESLKKRFYYLMVPVAALCGLATILAVLSKTRYYKNFFKNKRHAFEPRKFAVAAVVNCRLAY
jgi:hypothetical protein